MSRTIELREDAVVLQLTGLTSLAALKRKLVIPYQCITNISTQGPKIESLMRLGGTSMGNHHHGEFWGDGWYFLSYDDPNKVISLTLRDFADSGRTYVGIVLGVDDPEEMRKTLAARCQP